MHDWDDDRIFQRACVGLAREGLDVHLVAIAGKDDQVGEFSKFGVQVHLIEHRSGLKRRWDGSKAVFQYAAKLGADLYHFHDPDLLPHTNIIKRQGGLIVYDIHENYAGRFKNWGLPAFLGTFFRKYELAKINTFDGITVVSASMSKLFDKSTTPIEITRNSTDISRLSHLDLGTEKRENEVITSGSHSHARNCLQTVQAIPFLNEELDAKVSFKFAGKYLHDIDQEMQEQARSDGTETQLALEGMLPWEENFIRISGSTVGCVFYEDNANNRVGIPNRLFEYMYCGLPVVVSDFPELKEIVEGANCGVVIDSENPKEIALGIAEILRDSGRAKEMGANGKKAVQESLGFHVDLANLIAFYQALVAKKDN